MQLSLYNSLRRQKEIFNPIDPNLVKMYVCGPTVYDRPHIGNARSVVVYDVLYRILIKIFGSKKVLYVRNITDIDDKIIMRAKNNKISIAELTEKTTNYFHEDMEYLGCKRPNIEPKATEHVDVMIEIINRLIAQDVAYIANNHIYFDVTKVKNYHALSGRTFEKSLGGTRVDTSLGKKHPEDFVLWKPASKDDDESAIFQSPFGFGRPGWHIECSAMSYKYLGENFDIHGGGADLIFPHHTNEIAQSCCAFPRSRYAKLWIHNGFLTVNSEKMSKSLGNFTTVQDLQKQGIKGEVSRLFLLSNHYRKPIDYNQKAINDSKQMLAYWYRAIEDLDDIQNVEIPDIFWNSLLDDMNISAAIKIINDFAKQTHNAKSNQGKKNKAVKLVSCARFLGLMQKSTKEWFEINDNQQIKDVEKLMQERLEAKNKKDWIKADEIRQTLYAMNIEVEDKLDGSSVWKKS